MSSPQHEREMLLSDALDGMLDDGSQAEFVRLLTIDSSFAKDFEDLRTIREDLRCSFADIRPLKISDEAVGRIHAAILAADVPKMLVTTRDAVAANRHGGRLVRRVTVAAVLAATLLLAVKWIPAKDKNANPPRDAIAVVDNDRMQSMDASEPEFPKQSAMDTPASKDDISPILAETKPQTPANGTAIPVPPIGSVMTNPTADSVVANVDAKTNDSETRYMPSVVLVVSVKLSPIGRDELAVEQALRQADIAINRNNSLGNEVVACLRQANMLESPSATALPSGRPIVKLLYLEGSATRIDQLIDSFLSDPRLFESVELGLVTDPPLLAAMIDMREIDPTKITRGGLAQDLLPADGHEISLQSDVPFAAITKDSLGGMLEMASPDAMTSAGSGDDFQSQVLLLVN